MKMRYCLGKRTNTSNSNSREMQTFKRWTRRRPKLAAATTVAAAATAGCALYYYVVPKFWEKVEELQTTLQNKAMEAVMSELKAQEEEERADEHLKTVIAESRLFVEALLPTLRDRIICCTGVESALKDVRSLTKERGSQDEETVAAWSRLKVACLTRLILAVYGISLTVLVSTVQRILWAKASFQRDCPKVSQKVKDDCLRQSTEQIWGTGRGGIQQLYAFLEPIVSKLTADWGIKENIDMEQLNNLFTRVQQYVHTEKTNRTEGGAFTLGNLTQLVVPALNVAPPGGTDAERLIAEAKVTANSNTPEKLSVECDENFDNVQYSKTHTDNEKNLVNKLLDQSFDILESPNCVSLIDTLVKCGLECASTCCANEISQMTAATVGGIHSSRSKTELDGSTGASLENDIPNVPLASLLPRIKTISSNALTIGKSSPEKCGTYLDRLYQVSDLHVFAELLYRRSSLSATY